MVGHPAGTVIGLLMIFCASITASIMSTSSSQFQSPQTSSAKAGVAVGVGGAVGGGVRRSRLVDVLVVEGNRALRVERRHDDVDRAELALTDVDPRLALACNQDRLHCKATVFDRLFRTRVERVRSGLLAICGHNRRVAELVGTGGLVAVAVHYDDAGWRVDVELDFLEQNRVKLRPGCLYAERQREFSHQQ